MKIIHILLLFLSSTLLSCESVLFEEEPANDPIGNFESLWKTFDEKYAVFEQRNVDWRELYEMYRPQITERTTNEQLFQIITSMLSHLDDGHVSLMAENKPFWNSHKEFREQTGNNLFSFSVIRDRYLQGDLKNINNQYVYGKIDDNIGYLYIGGLGGDKPNFIDDFIQENKNSRGIIIDLRHNGGGDFTNGEVIASRFAGSKTLAFSAQPKNGPSSADYGEITEYFIEAQGEMQFDKPVIVLMNRYTISAGENLVLYLRVLPNVTIIGENTSGAMGERIEKEMPNGWIYSITAQILTAADGKIYEGPGIPPDIFSLNTEIDLENGVDQMLERAVEEIN